MGFDRIHEKVGQFMSEYEAVKCHTVFFYEKRLMFHQTFKREYWGSKLSYLSTKHNLFSK